MAILIGAVMGTIAHLLVVNQRDRNEVVIVVFGLVLFTTAVAMDLGNSPLLANMATAFAMVNLPPAIGASSG